MVMRFLFIFFCAEADVDKLVKADYTFAQRILDIIDSFIYHIKDKFGGLEGDEKTLAERAAKDGVSTDLRWRVQRV